MKDNQIVSFNKIGYDPFIDFLKAYSIFLVVFGHALPVVFYDYTLFWVWGGMQVPVFILIQVFHAYKKGKVPTINWNSMLKRIVIPFTVVQAIILSFRILFSTEDASSVLISSVHRGGYGPGSYYFWIYIQVAIILVLIWPLVQKLTRKQLTIILLILSIGCEVLFSLIDLPDFIYRLLAVRYLFLVPLAFIWIEEGVVLNVKNVILSIVSIFAVIFFRFFKFDLEPFFYNTGWATHRWICYFYLPILLTYVLYLLFKLISKSECLSKMINKVAKSSYEIFLIQMIVFVFCPIDRLSFIQSSLFRLPIWMLLTFVLSIIGGIMMNWIMQKFLVEKK